MVAVGRESDNITGDVVAYVLAEDLFAIREIPGANEVFALVAWVFRTPMTDGGDALPVGGERHRHDVAALFDRQVAEFLTRWHLPDFHPIIRIGYHACKQAAVE